MQSNLEILTALKQNDEKAFEDLFKSYYQRLCTFAHSILHDVDEAEEIVQNVFLNVWEKRAAMQINISVQSYLYSAVRNACFNKIKHGKVRQLYAQEQEAIATTNVPASHITFENDLQKQIHEAIESLPEQCRIVFKLSRFEELKYAEIAEQLNISVKTVENQMGKALKVMRLKLKGYLVILILILSHYIV